MAIIQSKSQAQGVNNEDFVFTGKVGNAEILIAGDFARSAFTGLDSLAQGQLERLLNDRGLTSAPIPELLAAIAVQFNNFLLDYRNGYKSDPDKIFQCCAVFAALSGAQLYYLPIGDCRIAVQRDKHLFLLNGSVWQDATGNPLSTIVTLNQEPRRGQEERPSNVLGVYPLTLSRAQVLEFPLERNDLVMLYSDGVDKVIAPVELLDFALLSSGGDSPSETEEAAKELVTQILNEVRSKFGDDDRTLLVAFGPHEDHFDPGRQRLLEQQIALSGPQRELAERQQSFDSQLRDLQQRLPDLSQLNEITGGIKSDLATLKNSTPSQQQIAEIERATNDIKYLLTDLSHSDDKLSAKQIETNNKVASLESKLDILSDLKRITEGIHQVISELSQEGEPPEPKRARSEDIHQITSKRSHPTTRSSLWSKLTGADQTEEIISRVEDLDSKVNTLPSLSDISEQMEQIISQHFPKISESASELASQQTNDLASSLSEHIQALSKKIDLLSPAHPDAPSDAEPSLSDQEDSNTDQSSQTASTPAVSRSLPSYLSKARAWLAEPLNRALVIIGVIALTAFILGYSVSSWSNPSSMEQTSQQAAASPTPQKPFGVMYDTQERMAWLIDSLGRKIRMLYYRSQFKSEEKLLQTIKDKQPGFDSEDEAKRWLDELGKSERTVTTNDWIDNKQFEQGLRSVEQADLSDSSGEQPCRSFLARINPPLPEGVHTKLDQLQALNPGIVCGQLKSGDQLMVFVAKKGHTAK